MDGQGNVFKFLSGFLSLVLILSLSSSVAAVLPTANLTAYWPLNNTLADYSGAGVWTTNAARPPSFLSNCLNGNYCAFMDNGNSTAQFANYSGPPLNGSWTLSLYINASPLQPATYPTIFASGTTGTNYSLWHEANSNEFYQALGGSSKANPATSTNAGSITNAFMNNTWHYYTIECQATPGDLLVYVDGNTSTNYVYHAANVCKQGYLTFSPLNFFTDSLDPTNTVNKFYGEAQRISFFNQALTTAQIAELYADAGNPLSNATVNSSLPNSALFVPLYNDTSDYSSGTHSWIQGAAILGSNPTILSSCRNGKGCGLWKPTASYYINYTGYVGSQFTVSFWMNESNTTTQFSRFYTAGLASTFGSTGASGFSTLFHNHNYSQPAIDGMGNELVLPVNPIPGLNQWNYYTVVCDAADSWEAVYTNGTLMDNQSGVFCGNSASTSFFAPLVFGAYWQDASNYGANGFDGEFQLISVFNSSLTSAQVSTLYNLGGDPSNFSANGTLIVPSLFLNTLDEQSLQGLNFNVSISNSTNTVTLANLLGIQNYTINQVPYGLISLTFNANNGSYRPRTINSFLANGVTTNITEYLLSSTAANLVGFHVINSASQAIVGANVAVAAQINGVYTLIANGVTGSDGTAAFYLNPASTYQVNASFNGASSLNSYITPVNNLYTISLVTATNFSFPYQFNNTVYSLTPVSVISNNYTPVVWAVNALTPVTSINWFALELLYPNGSILSFTNSSSNSSNSTIVTNTSNSSLPQYSLFIPLNNDTNDHSPGPHSWIHGVPVSGSEPPIVSNCVNGLGCGLFQPSVSEYLNYSGYIGGEWTIGFWMNVTATTNQYARFFSMGLSSTYGSIGGVPNDNMFHYHNYNQPAIAGLGVETILPVNPIPGFNQWNYYTVVCDAADSWEAVYTNGTLLDNETGIQYCSPSPSLSYAAPLNWGQQWYDAGNIINELNGELYNLIVFNSTLNSTQVLTLYNVSGNPANTTITYTSNSSNNSGGVIVLNSNPLSGGSITFNLSLNSLVFANVTNVTVIGMFSQTGFAPYNVSYVYQVQYYPNNGLELVTGFNGVLSPITLMVFSLIISLLVAGWVSKYTSSMAGGGAAIMVLGIFSFLGWVDIRLFIVAVIALAGIAAFQKGIVR